MNKLTKALLVAGSVAVLAACGSSNKTENGNGNGQTFGGYSVEGEYAQILDAHAAYLTATPATSVRVEGNTDERGTPEYNMALGERRAHAVQSFLTSKGVQGSQISTVSYGEEKPAVLGHDEAAYSKNRRAVLAY